MPKWKKNSRAKPSQSQKPKASSKVRREYRLEPGSKAQEEEGSGRTVQKNGDIFIKIPQSINAFYMPKNNYYDQVMGFPSI